MGSDVGGGEMRRRNSWIAAALLVMLAGAGAVAQLVQHRQHVDEERSIGVFDVQVDHVHRRWADIVFDHPVNVAAAGRVVVPPPAEVEPETAGVWRWRTKTKEERKIRIVIEKGVAEKESGAKLESDYAHEVLLGSIDKLSIHQAVAVSGESESMLRIDLSSEVNPEIAAKFITIKPAVK